MENVPGLRNIPEGDKNMNRFDEQKYFSSNTIALTTSRGAMFSYHPSATAPITLCHFSHRSGKGAAPLRDLNCCTVYLFPKGQFNFIIDNKVYKTEQNQIYVIPQHTPFTAFFFAEGMVDYYELNIPEEFFELTENKIYHELCFDFAAKYDYVTTVHGKAWDEVVQRLQHCDEMIAKRVPELDVALYASVLHILHITLMNFVDCPTEENDYPKVLKDAMGYMSAHFGDIQSVNEIAKACGISFSYLNRLFTKVYHCSVNNMLIQLKIQNAKSALQAGANVNEAAYRSGFSHVSYFIAVFKRIVGMTPLQYKKYMEARMEEINDISKREGVTWHPHPTDIKTGGKQ